MKKKSFKIEFIGDKNLIVPEYKIELFNKSKKKINTVENIFQLPLLKSYKDKREDKKKRNQSNH